MCKLGKEEGVEEVREENCMRALTASPVLGAASPLWAVGEMKNDMLGQLVVSSEKHVKDVTVERAAVASDEKKMGR